MLQLTALNTGHGAAHRQPWPCSNYAPPVPTHHSVRVGMPLSCLLQPSVRAAAAPIEPPGPVSALPRPSGTCADSGSAPLPAPAAAAVAAPTSPHAGSTDGSSSSSSSTSDGSSSAPHLNNISSFASSTGSDGSSSGAAAVPASKGSTHATSTAAAQEAALNAGLPWAWPAPTHALKDLPPVPPVLQLSAEAGAAAVAGAVQAYVARSVQAGQEVAGGAVGRKRDVGANPILPFTSIIGQVRV